MDRAILGVLLEPIRNEFHATDTQLGLLGGIAFALFYSTLGIPIAALADRSNRRNVLSLCVAVWSVMTALCGAATNFIMLLIARIGTAIGEAGGSPPSHAMISDYFALKKRATALSIYALGVPLGTMLGNFLGGRLNDLIGWRGAFIVVGLIGVPLALLIRFTVREPPRGYADRVAGAAAPAKQTTPDLWTTFSYLWQRTSFRHLTLAAALHSYVWYSGSTWNASFFIRMHGMTTSSAGDTIAMLALFGAVGTFLGGFLSDRLSVRFGDRRWYMWVPGIGCLVMVPFQFGSYLLPELNHAIPSFVVMVMLASLFFGPSFAMTQALAPLRMRAVATSILLFMQTLIGLGLGPLTVGKISDLLKDDMGDARSLAYGLVIVGLLNVWAAGHYFWGARRLRKDLQATESLTDAQPA
ncbi:MAG: MFS transporter [Gammaproteobacteria bacterium]|nr:MFS transporter [Gammaproteobacteria bacterium]